MAELLGRREILSWEAGLLESWAAGSGGGAASNVCSFKIETRGGARVLLCQTQSLKR